jgi:hypothetical protein
MSIILGELEFISTYYGSFIALGEFFSWTPADTRHPDNKFEEAHSTATAAGWKFSPFLPAWLPPMPTTYHFLI